MERKELGCLLMSFPGCIGNRNYFSFWLVVGPFFHFFFLFFLMSETDTSTAELKDR